MTVLLLPHACGVLGAQYRVAVRVKGGRATNRRNAGADGRPPGAKPAGPGVARRGSADCRSLRAYRATGLL